MATDLGTFADEESRPSGVSDILLQPRVIGCPVPLTAEQMSLWKRQEESLSDLRVCAASVRVLGPLNIDLLRRSIAAVVKRHESLRTRIIPVDGIPRQHIDPACEYHLEMIDLARVAPAGAERAATHLAREFVETRIDLSVGPLFEAKLLRLSNLEYVLILALDHIVSDAVSCVILSNEVWTLYNQAAQGRPFSLPQLPVQFADYAVWQQRTYGTWLKKHEAYWRERLRGAPRTLLPLDDGLAVKHPCGAMLHFPLGRTLSAKLRDMARHEGIQLPLVVLAIYAVVMSRWCNQGDLVIGFASHGRYSQPRLETMIGLLATSFFLRIEIAKEDSFLDLLKRVDVEFRSACDHSGFGQLPETVPECTTDVNFNWMPASWVRRSVHEDEKASGQVKTQSFPIRPFPAQPFRNVEASVKFAPVFSDTAARIVMSVRYRSNLFSARTIERFCQNLQLFAEEVTQRPFARVASVAPVS